MSEQAKQAFLQGNRKFIIVILAVIAIIVCNIFGLDDAIVSLQIIIPTYFAANGVEHYTSTRGSNGHNTE